MNIGHTIENIVKFLDVKEGNSVLDLGAGTGVFSKEFIKVTKNLTALDLNNKYFRKLEKLGIKTVKADICEYHDGNYDLILIANVYHHVRNICNEKFFENLNKMSKKYVAIIYIY
jgi:cyclopropane fatty-acyl-phospholipid synthase-like methyltransferase